MASVRLSGNPVLVSYFGARRSTKQAAVGPVERVREQLEEKPGPRGPGSAIPLN